MLAETPSRVRSAPGTLGDLLYGDPTRNCIFEGEWLELVQSIAAGDQFALRTLFDRTHRLVFTLIMRIRRHRETAERLTVDVFLNVLRDAATYDAAEGSVVAWLMNRARRVAIEDGRPAIARAPMGPARLEAVAALSPDERSAIEGAFFSGLTALELAARLQQPVDAVEASVRSGMAKLARRLGSEAPADRVIEGPRCRHAKRVPLYLLRALVPRSMHEAGRHIPACPECSAELQALRPVVDAFAFWPTNLLRPSTDLWVLVARRLPDELPGCHPPRPAQHRPELAWDDVAPGISCKLLATDTDRHRVSMLVRLAPGVEYPPHRHAGTEELHLLDGELWIDERKLWPGDYNRAEAGTADKRVWSETGCTCVLITSPMDTLG